MRYLAIIFVIGFIYNANAQMTGGGQGQGGVETRGAKVARGSNPNKISRLTIGLSQPMGKFKENDLTKPLSDAVGAKPGIYWAYDAGSFFSPEDSPSRFGILFSTGNSFNWTNWGPWIPGSTPTSSPFVLGNLMLGAIGSFKINEDMYVEGVFQLGLNLGAGAYTEWSGTSGFGSSAYLEELGLGVATGLGGNFVYKKLIVTANLNLGKLKFYYTAYDDGDLPASRSFDGYQKISVSTFRLGLGVKIK